MMRRPLLIEALTHHSSCSAGHRFSLLPLTLFRFAHTTSSAAVGTNNAVSGEKCSTPFSSRAPATAAPASGGQEREKGTAAKRFGSAHGGGATYIRPPKSIKDVQLHLPPHRYSFFSDDYRMPHLTYETSRLEDDAGVVAVDSSSVLHKDGDQRQSLKSPLGEGSTTTAKAATTLCNVYTKHREPADLTDRLARGLVTFARGTYDYFTGFAKYNHDLRGVAMPAGTELSIPNADGSRCPLAPSDLWLQRAIFLETVAAVPGMVAAMIRHLRSLRILRKDDGWIHSLLEEAENERMHLFFFLKEKEPSIPFRIAIAGAQGVFWLFNFFGYLISPRFMHRFVGYIEEEAVHTYSIILRDIDRGLTPADDRNTASNLPKNHISHWRTKAAPKDYIHYYDLHPAATYRDVVLCIRADELSHREHNHMYADAHALKAEADVGRILRETEPLNVGTHRE